MHFGRANQSYDYHMSNSKLEVVAEDKDLGVWISQDLKVSQDCLQAYSKANKLLGVLNLTVKCQDAANLLCFYKSSGILYSTGYIDRGRLIMQKTNY